jgi:hypothetical protein
MGRLNFDSESDIFKLNIGALLELYDQDPNYDKLGSPITAITSLIGEDLLLGLFDHYLQSIRDGVVSLDYSCKAEGQRGHRLDAWIETKHKPEILYQAEIKNWSASAIGGRPIGNTTDSLLRVAEHNRKRYLNHSKNSRKVWKVLLNATTPDWHTNRNNRLYLLIFWSPIAPKDTVLSKTCLNPFFEVKTEEFRETIKGAGIFIEPYSYPEKVWIFSASNYLRGLRDCDLIPLRMPRVKQRLEKIRDLGFPINI